MKYKEIEYEIARLINVISVAVRENINLSLSIEERQIKYSFSSTSEIVGLALSARQTINLSLSV